MARDGDAVRIPHSSIFDAFAEGVLIVDRQWRYKYANLAAVRTLKSPAHTFIGRDMWEVHPTAIGTRTYHELQRAMRDNAPVRFQDYYEALDLWHDTVAYPLDDGLIIIGIDITEYKRELHIEQRARADAELENRQKDEFLTTVAHELRQPLHAAEAALAVMKARKERSAGERARAVVERQLRRMSILVDDLLEAARIVRGQMVLHPRPVDIRQLIDHAVDTVAPLVQERNQRLEVTVPRETCWIEADEERLEQVMVNLLANAAKYTAAAGRIGITVAPSANRLVIRVQDTGRGIPQKELSRIFDLFARVRGHREGGSGIGLAVARQLVEQHGGTVVARSDGPGRGSEFIVDLPMACGAVPTAS